jgi:hypothetical protein
MPDENELFKRPNLVTFTCKLLLDLAFPARQIDRRSNRFDNFSTKIGIVQKLAMLKIGNRSRSIWYGGMPD